MTRYDGIMSIWFRPQEVGDDSALMIPSQAEMGELDEAWAAALSEAEQKARLSRAQGRRRVSVVEETERPHSQGGWIG